jgi:hypothetical protein
MNPVNTPYEQKIMQKIATLQEQLREIKQNRTVVCPNCSTQTPISESTVVKTHHYVQPYGCTGGDYYVHDGYLLYCSHCEQFSQAYLLSSDRVEGSRTAIRPELINSPRIVFYSFIEKHFLYFGEQLSWYDTGPANINDIRASNKRMKEREEDLGW